MPPVGLTQRGGEVRASVEEGVGDQSWRWCARLIASRGVSAGAKVSPLSVNVALLSGQIDVQKDAFTLFRLRIEPTMLVR